MTTPTLITNLNSTANTDPYTASPLGVINGTFLVAVGIETDNAGIGAGFGFRLNNLATGSGAITTEDGESIPFNTAGIRCYDQGTSANHTADTTSGSAIMTNVSAPVAGDLGKTITGPGVPAGTYITLVNVSGQIYVLSQNATANNTGQTYAVAGVGPHTVLGNSTDGWLYVWTVKCTAVNAASTMSAVITFGGTNTRRGLARTINPQGHSIPPRAQRELAVYEFPVGRTDACTTTSGSAVVTDASIQASDLYRSVSGSNITTPSHIIAVTPGVSFTMNQNAVSNGATNLVIGGSTAVKLHWVKKSGTAPDGSLAFHVFMAFKGGGTNAAGNAPDYDSDGANDTADVYLATTQAAMWAGSYFDTSAANRPGANFTSWAFASNPGASPRIGGMWVLALDTPPIPVDLASETDVAMGVNQIHPVGFASETDEAMQATTGLFIDTALEADSAQALNRVFGVGPATETEQALPLSRLFEVGTAAEIDDALGITDTWLSWHEEYDINDLAPGAIAFDLRVRSRKENLTDAGEVRFMLKGNGDVLDTSPWDALTNSFVDRHLTPANGALFGQDLTVRVEYRRLLGDLLTPNTSEIELLSGAPVIVTGTAETDVALSIISHDELNFAQELDQALGLITISPVPPVIPTPSAGFRMYDLARVLLNCVCQKMGTTCPTRRCVVPGIEPSFENCCSGDKGGQLTVNVVNSYLSRSFPSEDFTSAEPCDVPLQVYTYRVTVARCAPVGHGNHPPECSELDAAALQLMNDQELILDALMCCLRDHEALEPLLGAGYRHHVGSAQTVGPEGGCVGVTQDVVIGLPTCWVCT